MFVCPPSSTWQSPSKSPFAVPTTSPSTSNPSSVVLHWETCVFQNNYFINVSDLVAKCITIIESHWNTIHSMWPYRRNVILAFGGLYSCLFVWRSVLTIYITFSIPKCITFTSMTLSPLHQAILTSFLCAFFVFQFAVSIIITIYIIAISIAISITVSVTVSVTVF